MENELIIQGALLDERNAVEKDRDFSHDEVASSFSPVQWTKKAPHELKKFKERFQLYSSSCMAQSGSKMLGVTNSGADPDDYEEISALPIYSPRVNKPQLGMTLPDLLAKVSSKNNVRLESDIKSQNMSEEQMNVPFIPIEVSEEDDRSASKYFYLPSLNLISIDDIASITAAGMGVELMIFANGDEYWKPKPNIIHESLSPWDASVRHGLCGVDFTLTADGEKAIYIDDSSGNNTGIDGKGNRLFTESFLKARCYGAAYVTPKKIRSLDKVKPVAYFTVPLFYGMRNNDGVRMLQAILQYEGFLDTQIGNQPLNPTGNFLGLTAKALVEWQVAHKIYDFKNEKDVRKIRFGSKSIALAQKLYGR